MGVVTAEVVDSWESCLGDLFAQVAGRFAPVETRLHVAHLAHEDAVLIADETGFLKKGRDRKSVV